MLQIVEDETGLYSRCFPAGIDMKDPPEMPRHVDDHGGIATLAGEARSTAARQYRNAVLPAYLNRCDDVIGCSRQDNADRYLTVVRGIGGV